jgi:hypothetical protein
MAGTPSSRAIRLRELKSTFTPEKLQKLANDINKSKDKKVRSSTKSPQKQHSLTYNSSLTPPWQRKKDQKLRQLLSAPTKRRRSISVNPLQLKASWTINLNSFTI